MTATTTLQHVTSADGTDIAYERLGSGPVLILVSGGSVDRMSNAGLAHELARDFTVINHDRRGRGDSGDTRPYAVEREIEDIAALLDAEGGSAALYGSSSGAALALQATRALQPRITKLVMWEPPYFVDPAARPPLDTVETYERLVAEGRRADAVEYFMTQVVRLPQEFADFAKTQPWWAGQERIAHTLAYDGRVMGDYLIPTATAEAVTVPAIVIVGGASFGFFGATAEALAAALPNGSSTVIEGQEHNVAPEALAPVVKAFLAG
jgi:pimeloyl-ACP methyl ester carboxylesterase